MDEIDLHVALVRAARQHGVAPDDRASVDRVIYLLSEHPALAAEWGRVLTEHAASEALAVTVHPYIPARQGVGCAAPSRDGGPCHQTADTPVHRVERLPEDCRRALELWAGAVKYQPGESVASHAMTTLIRLGPAVDAGAITGQMRATDRGRAWLQAHPRTDGGDAR